MMCHSHGLLAPFFQDRHCSWGCETQTNLTNAGSNSCHHAQLLWWRRAAWLHPEDQYRFAVVLNSSAGTRWHSTQVLPLCRCLREGVRSSAWHKLNRHKNNSPDEVPAAFNACELAIRFGSSCFLAASMVLIRQSSRRALFA